MAQTQQRVIGSVPASWHLPRLPSKRGLGLAAIFLIVAIVLALGARVASSAFASRSTSTPIVPAVQQSVAQPVQQVTQNQPSGIVAPKVHVEWTQIGIAHNGDEVVALGIPWDKLIRVPLEPIDNLPPGVMGITGMGGLPTERGTLIPYIFFQTQPWVYTYWKGSEIPISYASKPWVYTQTGKVVP